MAALPVWAEVEGATTRLSRVSLILHDGETSEQSAAKRATVKLHRRYQSQRAEGCAVELLQSGQGRAEQRRVVSIGPGRYDVERDPGGVGVQGLFTLALDLALDLGHWRPAASAPLGAWVRQRSIANSSNFSPSI